MKQTKIEILKYYVCDQEGKIKTFNRSRELIDTYVNYIEDKGYVALGLEPSPSRVYLHPLSANVPSTL